MYFSISCSSKWLICVWVITLPARSPYSFRKTAITARYRDDGDFTTLPSRGIGSSVNSSSLIGWGLKYSQPSCCSKLNNAALVSLDSSCVWTENLRVLSASVLNSERVAGILIIIITSLSVMDMKTPLPIAPTEGDMKTGWSLDWRNQSLLQFSSSNSPCKSGCPQIKSVPRGEPL